MSKNLTKVVAVIALVAGVLAVFASPPFWEIAVAPAILAATAVASFVAQGITAVVLLLLVLPIATIGSIIAAMFVVRKFGARSKTILPTANDLPNDDQGRAGHRGRPD